MAHLPLIGPGNNAYPARLLPPTSWSGHTDCPPAETREAGDDSVHLSGAALAALTEAEHAPVDRGQAAVDMARDYLGWQTRHAKGSLPHFTAAGGKSNNCADFVSSILQNQGLLKRHHNAVPELARGLLKEGYKRVPEGKARPGDVWIDDGGGHTELVAEARKGKGTHPKLIGSNNGGKRIQSVSENRPYNRGRYYQLPEANRPHPGM